MIAPRRPAVNPLNFVLLGSLSACTPVREERSAPLPPLEELPRLNAAPSQMTGGNRANNIATASTLRDRPVSRRLRDLPRARVAARAGGAPWTDAFDLLGPPLTGGRFDLSLGAELEEALADANQSQVEAYGVAALSADELWGDNFRYGSCVNGEVSVDVQHQGEAYTVTFDAATYFWFLGEPTAWMTTLSEDCRAALEASGGRISKALREGCVEDDEAAFFEEGSDCRACLEEAGDLEGCEDEGRCPLEAPIEFWVLENGVEQRWYDAAEATIFACAPDWTSDVILLANIADDGTLPESFDHENWAYLCYPVKSGRSVEYSCVDGWGGPALGDALLEGVSARLVGARRDGEEALEHPGRMLYTHSLTLEDGQEFRYTWGFTPTGSGVISMPQVIPDSNGNGVTDLGDENFGFGLGGWGLNPHALRPGGSDPGSLDDTYARDWNAVYALKFSTEINGVVIHAFDHNRCAEGAWEGPFDDGTWRCNALEAPAGDWPLDDAENTWVDSTWTQAYALPLATTGSTGLPDPDVPSGAVIYMAGTEALANPRWDGCTWPHQFKPDLAPYEDTPGVFGARASLWGDTYKFGKDPDMDLRAVLLTNRIRRFCPPEGR